jgi:hypothetical protein
MWHGFSRDSPLSTKDFRSAIDLDLYFRLGIGRKNIALNINCVQEETEIRTDLEVFCASPKTITWLDTRLGHNQTVINYLQTKAVCMQ